MLREEVQKLPTAPSSSHATLLALRAYYRAFVKARPLDASDFPVLPDSITKMVGMLRTVSRATPDIACPIIDPEETIKGTWCGVEAAQANVRAAAAAADSIADATLQNAISARDLARANHARTL